MFLERQPDPDAMCVRADLPDEFKTLAAYLGAHCRGQENAATSRDIGRWLGYSGSDPGRPIRALISIFHDEFPFVVIGDAQAGYFVTDDPADMTHYDRTLNSRLRCLAARLSKFRRNCRRQGFQRSGTGNRVEYESHQTAVSSDFHGI